MVDSAEERHGVGRPRRVYYLTEEGLEHFPSRYLRLTLRLLEQLKGTMPSHMVSQLFAQMAEDVASDYQVQLMRLDMEQRLNLVTELLRQEGFVVNWEKGKDEYIIREIGCPYYHVGQDHPEVCSVDQTLISPLTLDFCFPLRLRASAVKNLILERPGSPSRASVDPRQGRDRPASG